MINVSTEYMNLIYEDSTKVDCQVIYGVYDLTGKSSTTPSTTDKQSFSNVSDTLVGVTDFTRYSTLERNHWLLDGNTRLFPNDTSKRRWAWWSQSQSNDEGTFENTPTLVYTWNENHTSIGLQLVFGEPVLEFRVNWYNEAGTLIDTYTYTNEDYNNKEYRIEHGVQNYRKIEIEVLKTFPNHYAKIYSISFGLEFVWNNEIINVSVDESVSPTAQEIQSNQTVVSINDIEQNYNKYNPQNRLVYLQEGQRMEVQTIVSVNGVNEFVPLGVFYLTSWGNPTEYTAEFVANDLIMKLEGQYLRSKYYENATAETIIEDLFDDYNLYVDNDAQYVIADNVKEVLLTGYIPVISYREALQQICFALGAICKVNRYGKIYIYRLEDADTVELIGHDKKQYANDNEQVKYSSVSVTEYSYKIKAELETLFEGEVTGNQTIMLSSPATNITISGTYTSFTAYASAVDIVGASGNIVVTGNTYEVYGKKVTKSRTDIPLGITTQNVDVEGIYLIGNSNTSSYVSNWFLGAIERNITNEFKWLGNPAIEIGDFVEIEVNEGYTKKAIVTKNNFTYNGALLETSEVTL